MRKPSTAEIAETGAAWIGEKLTRPPLRRRLLDWFFPRTGLLAAVCCGFPVALALGAFLHAEAHRDWQGATLIGILAVSSWGLWRIAVAGWEPYRNRARAMWRWLALRVRLLLR